MNRDAIRTTVPSRGQPLVALALMLSAWVAARAVLLQADEGMAELPRDRAPVGPAALPREQGALRAGPLSRAATAGPAPSSPARIPEAPHGSVAPFLPLPAGRGPALPPPVATPLIDPAPGGGASVTVPVPEPVQPRPAFAPVPPARAGGHLALWMAAVGHLPLPRFDAAPAAPRDPAPTARQGSEPSRWSADGWLLLRRGGSADLAASLASVPAGPTYGASQLGAVVRYRLVPSSAHRPAAYLRASAALNGSRERELAAGLSARPAGKVPVIVAAELRASGGRGATRLRPAVSAVSELPPLALPGGLRAEAYVQAGYVAGRGATTFVDGQLRIDGALGAVGPGGPVGAIGRAELRAGAGAWGGAQQGAARLDIGPTATLGIQLNPALSARLGLEWRLRVAGQAAPASGPAITLSAGF